MKPMLAREYTLPVGNECIIPTYEEALRFFTLQGWKGEVWFGLAETETHDIMGWGIRSGNRYRVVSAFKDVDKAPILAFNELERGSRFVYRNRTYLLTHSKDHRLIIREMTALPSEGEIRGSMEAMGKTDFNVHMVKMYEIGMKQRYLAPSWYIETPEESDEPDAFMPVFFSDLPLLDSVPVNSLNWEFLDPGDTFVHDKELWQLYEDETHGLFVNRPCFKDIFTKRRFPK